MSPAEKKRKAARQSIRQPQKRPLEPSPKGEARQPMIVRTTENQMMGIRSFAANRYVIGYVVSGYKFIYTGDLRCEITPGDVFFLSKGTHYIEEVPDGRKPFEQILFFYTAEQIGRVIAQLGVGYNIDTSVHHSCEECMLREYVVSPAWDALHTFFSGTGKNLREGFFSSDFTAEALALTSLVYQIISRPEGCLRTRVLGSTDAEKELMERQLRDYIFSDITLEEFAKRTNRSLSSFKKKFKEYYNESPHRWVIRQRLMHARLQVISTDRDINTVADDCRFPNPSYFIRLFRHQFGHTPAQYRAKYGNSAAKFQKPKQPKEI
jgi:AraC-like DNA-binding protein